MVHGKNCATFTRNILFAFEIKFQTQVLPERLNGPDYWGIDKISHERCWLASLVLAYKDVLLDMSYVPAVRS